MLALAQTPPRRVVHIIDETQAVTLQGNVHPLARAEFDRGPVSAEMRLERMILVLKPSADRQAALDALVEAQHDPQSPLFHKWVTPADFAARFGLSSQDLAQVAGWLASHGFTVDDIPASNRLILFSGTAGQVADTFHTEIHRYQVDGMEHTANAQDPQIPAELAGVVDGIVSLHDFRRTAANTGRQALGAGARPAYSAGSTHYLFPADFAAIYDLNPLYSAGATGTGTSIAIVGRSNINLSDVSAFRAQTGLAAKSPTVILAGADPGLVSGDQDEATLDVEWAGAVAPAVAVKIVVGASTATSDGVDLSAQYIVNHALAPVISTSYGSCEQEMGAAELAFYNSLWQQAASQGMSSFVASGDAGAAGCALAAASSGSGAGVNGLCSSPYSTCVGGTEFNEGSNPAAYWSATNSTSYESALGYIPEEVWNESRSNGGTDLWATGGGASQVYAQPAWQRGVSGASTSNGMRAVPDVALSAAAHDGYVINENGSCWIISGTSAASPAFAGIMALLVQATGGVGQGNANAGLYPLLNATHNPFHATPSGNNSVPGVAGFTASGAAYNLATGLGSVDGAVLVGRWISTSGSGPDFALTASASGGTVLTGQTATFTVSVTESGSAKNAVTLSATGTAGIALSVQPATVLPGTAATVTIGADASAPMGAQNLTITGTDASGTQIVTYALTVQQAPGIQLSVSPAALSMLSRSTVTVTATATPVGGATVSAGAASSRASEYSGPPRGIRSPLRGTTITGLSMTNTSGATISLISGLPKGITASWSAPTVAASGAVEWTLTLTGCSTAVAGNSTLTLFARAVDAKTGALFAASQSVPMTVTLSQPAFRVAQPLVAAEGSARRGSAHLMQ
jgi:subtilase family serine protease